jgi:hypothetical protein
MGCRNEVGGAGAWTVGLTFNANVEGGRGVEREWEW